MCRQGHGGEHNGQCSLTLDGPMDSQELIAEKLAAAIDDEFNAQAFYSAVLEKYGDIRPFSRIIR